MTGWAIAVAVVVLVLVAGAVAVVVARRGDPPTSPSSPAHPASPTAPAVGSVLPRDLAAPAGGLVLLQFSASFSRSCRDTRGVLADVAAELPGVTHREIDLATRPELPSRLGVDTTPTTLLVDAGGTELLRVAGVPRHRELAAAVATHLPRRAV